MRCLCMPMAHRVFGTSRSGLPGVLGTTPVRRHAVHPHPLVAVPARGGPGHGSSAPTSARCRSQPHATRSSVGFGCHPTLLHHAACSGTGKISWEVIFGRVLVHLQTSAASPGIPIKHY